jgi:hypothetical protein
MSTLKVNNLEPTSGTVVIINADTKIVSSTGKEIDLGGTTNDFSGSLNVTGSITNKDGNLIIENGNLTLKSGSLECTGSADFDGDVTVTGSFETTGSVTLTGSLDVQGDSTFTGDMIISGCLDIFCYTDKENPVFWGVDGRTTPDVSGFEVVSINYSTYGDLTAGIAAAAASSNNICYIYDPTVGTYAPYAYAGTNFDGVVTYISASGPSIPTGTIVQIGFPFPIPGATPIYPIGTGSLTPVASFCCDEIILYSDVTISGGLDVYGPTNLHDGLIITGCIEMLCPGDPTTSWYGYSGNTRFSKASSSVYLNYAYLNSSYGDVRIPLSASAAANSGTLQIYNANIGTTQTAPFVKATWTGQITLVEYVTNTLTNFGTGAPGPVIHMGNQSPNLYPFGADVLMGSGSATLTQTAIFCCDGNTLYGGTTFTGSVTITGSTFTSGSVVITGPTEVSGSLNVTGSITNKDGNLIIENGNLTLKSGSFTNTGSFNNTGSITNTGSFNNTGSITNTGSFNNTGSITNTGSFNNTGSITNTGSFNNTGSIINAGGFINTGSIVNSGSFTNVGNITVSGSIITSGSIKSNTLILNTILDAPPVYSGSKGEMVFVIDSDNYYLYAFLNDTWRSSSFA